jgi:hypothetical protein
VRRDGSLLVPIVCPSSVIDGCPTTLRVALRPIRNGRPDGPYRSVLPRYLDQLAGAQETVVVRTFSGLQRLIRRSRRLDVVVHTTAKGSDTPIRRRFTVARG